MSERRSPDIRAELDRLAKLREMMNGGKRGAVKGLPPEMIPPSGVGGDIPENRNAETWE